MKVISIGSAIIDMFVRSRDFTVKSTDDGVMLCQKYGSKIELDSFELHTGGGGGNTAVGFARLGFEAAVVAETGRDLMSKLVIEDLTHEQVATNYLIKEKKEETGGSIILTGQDGGRTALVHRGAASQLDPQDIPTEALAKADWIHLSSVAGRFLTLQNIFSTVKQHQVKISWNPGSAELKLVADGSLDVNQIYCQILFLNDEEWLMVAALQAKLLAQIPMIVVTKGKKGGSVYYRGKLEFDYDILKVDTVEETGAGDAFAVGFVSAYLHQKSLLESCEWGKKNAASVVKAVGAKKGLLTLAKIKS
jgi:ribokinase